MLFDLTKKVELEPRWQKYYLAARLILWLAFFAAGAYLAWLILFPTQTFFIKLFGPGSDRDTQNNFSFSTDPLFFDAFSRENFTDVEIVLDQVKDREALNGQEIRTRKSYQAFEYPLADRPIGFPSGSLLKNGSNYYMVSGDELRRFSSRRTVESLGYAEGSFSEASSEELSYSIKGAEISDVKAYPDDALFSIAGTYYRIQDQKLYPFVSDKAFESFFDPGQAIAKDESFLQEHPVSENSQGFSDGTLLSFDISVFMVVDGKIMPFNHPETFLSFGFDWKDIVPASEDEIGLYERDKLFSIDQPHPTGTVFKTAKEGKHYLIRNGKKWPIQGEGILKAYLKKSPVLVDEEGLEFKNFCRLKEKFWSFDSFSCSISISNLARYAGNDYQIETGLSSDNNIQDVTIIFSRDINWPNMRDSLSKIKQRILKYYGYATPN